MRTKWALPRYEPWSKQLELRAPGRYLTSSTTHTCGLGTGKVHHSSRLGAGRMRPRLLPDLIHQAHLWAWCRQSAPWGAA